MTAPTTLTADLRAEVKRLEDDLRVRTRQPDVDAEWRAQHREALSSGRTAASWQEWSDDRITLAAVAWVLVTVFIRFLEDNQLVKPVWISGPRHRRQEALDAQAAFLREAARTNPDVTDREWLREAISYVSQLPATKALVDETSALWLVTPSGDAASRLLEFWRERDEAGGLVRDLRDDTWDTRFLGDLYQDLSEEAQSRYALLQTPVFVEEFILDRTMEPALKERPLDGFRMIDPTCGSGHFLLGAFPRLLERWRRAAPDLEDRVLAQKALDAIHGVDLNPYAVAITRFRLTIAALKESGEGSLEGVPDFKFHLAVGDSLLHGLGQLELDLGAEYSADRAAATYVYPTENLAALRSILENGRYDVVVGNPPYITVKDKALNALYREHYHYCKGTYALTVPFMERFFDLAKGGERAGWVGQITSNSFMKREFGAPLIEKFFPTMDLRLVVDSEGAWIPGHNMDGTPTVIIVGLNRGPQSSAVRTVLSKGLRESRAVGNDGKGPYWSAIAGHLDEPAFDNEWVSIVDLDRNRLSKHPWSLVGGGARDVLNQLDSAKTGVLKDRGIDIGRTTHTGADDAFYLPDYVIAARGIKESTPVVSGDDVRDFTLASTVATIFPYGQDGKPIAPSEPALRLLWLNRAQLAGRIDYQQTLAERGLRWFDHSMFFARRYCAHLLLTFAGVASHNHFVLNSGWKVYNRWCPTLILLDGVDR